MVHTMTKRLVCVMAAVVLTAAMGATAFAEDSPTVVTDNTGDNDAIRQYIGETGSTTAAPMPKDIQNVNENGTALIIKTFEVSPDYLSDQLVEADFDQNGYRYAKREILKVEETYSTETRLASKIVMVEHEKKEGVLAKFEPLLDYDEDGFQGQLELDVSAIVTEAAGSESYTYDIFETREYPGFARNDTYGVPKSIDKNGVTLALSDIEWISMGNASVDGLAVYPTYTAVAKYGGKAIGYRTNGYTSTGIYKGEVVKKTPHHIIYAIVYEGTKIPLPPIPPNYVPLIFAVLVCMAGIVVAILWIYRKNTKIYALNEGKYYLAQKARLEYSNPVLDLSNVEYLSTSNDYYIVIDRFAAKRLNGRDIKVVRVGLEPLTHHLESNRNEYEFRVTYESVSPTPNDELFDFSEAETAVLSKG